MSQINFYSDLGLDGALTLEKDYVDFPTNPKIGTLIRKGNVIYAYITIGDLETWYPFSKQTKSYIHTQGLANQTWTVNHNLGSTDVWIQVTDNSGNIINVGKSTVDSNSFTLNFTVATVGKVVVVAPDSIDVPVVKASQLNVADGYVLIDNSGIKINNEYVLTAAVIDQEVNAALANLDVYTKGEIDTALTAKAATSSLAAVATSGSYNDLTNKPVAISAVSELTNDSGYQTAADVDAAINTLIGTAPAALDTLGEIAAQLASDESAAAALTNTVAGKQAALVSGTNIKTINGTSLLGSGDLTIISGSAGGSWYAYFPGITVNVFGTVRKYPADAMQIVKLAIWCSSAAPTDTTVTLKKNGTSVGSATITAGSTNANVVWSANNAGRALTSSDYLTIDLTSQGAVDVGVRIDYQ